MPRTPLTATERSELTNVPALNDRIARGGWQLSGRLVEQLNWSGLRLTEATLTDVRFEDGRWDDVAVKGGGWRDVDFEGIALNGVRFENTRFERCDFLRLTATSATFTNCTFVECGFGEARFEQSSFTDCRFEKGEAVKTVWSESTLERVAMSTFRLAKGGIYRSRVEAVTFAQCQLRDWSFDEGTGMQVVFQQGRLEETTIAFSVADRIGIDGTEISGLGFGGRMNRLVWKNSPRAERVKFSGSELAAPYLSDLPAVSGLDFLSSQVNDLTLRDLRVEQLGFAQSVVSNGVLANCKIDGLDWKLASVQNSRIEQSTLDYIVVLRGATFRGLKLTGVRYGSHVEFVGDDAKFENSDRFGR